MNENILEMKIVPKFKILSRDEYKIYSVYNLMEDDCFNYAMDYDLEVIVGNMPELILGVQYNIEAELIENKQYGLQYKVHKVYKNDYSKQDEYEMCKLLFKRKVLKKIMSKTEYPITDILNEKINHNNLDIEYEELSDMKQILQNHKMYISLVPKFHKIDITFKTAKKIIDKYGYEAVKIIKDNPYKLYTDINGIGFKRSDQIAMKLGIKKNSEKRITACIMFVLESNMQQSNTWMYTDDLLTSVEDILEIEIKDINKYIYNDNFYLNMEKISLTKAVMIERSIVQNLNRINLSYSKKCFSENELEDKINDISIDNKINYSDEQIEFIKSINYNNVVLLNGAAGTGKTMSVRALLGLYKHHFCDIQLVSPTAKAAKVLSKMTDMEAKTIHRLLGWRGDKFYFNKMNRLATNLLIVDESSMIDMMLFNSLLNAIDDNCKIIIIGDFAQLESVKCGNVFYDLVKSNVYKTIIYSNVYRQALESGILNVATCIRRDKKWIDTTDFKYENKAFHGFKKIKNNFYLLATDKDNMLQKIIGAYKEALIATVPDDIMIISPYKKGDLGVYNINKLIQYNYNNQELKIKLNNGYDISIGDKVKHTENEYDRDLYSYFGELLNKKGVFNGDFGKVINIENGIIFVDYEDKIVRYEKPYKNLELAYCITCHSSQGSQSKIVIGVLDVSHYINLKKNLLYTMITRAESYFVLIASIKAINICMNNKTVEKKNTYLKDIAIGNKI